MNSNHLSSEGSHKFIKDNIIDKLYEKSIRSAYKFVRNKLETSDLDLLDIVQQNTYNKHKNKLTILKARIQEYIDNISNGIDNLDEATVDLEYVVSCLNEIDQNKNHILENKLKENNESFSKFGLIWERLNMADSLYKKCNEANELINAVEQYFIENPKSISIKCYKTIESLLEFEKELLENIKDIKNKEFIIQKFYKIHESNEILVNNVNDILKIAFYDGSDLKEDIIIRAIWIFLSNYDISSLIEYVQKSIIKSFNYVIEINESNLDNYIEKLMNLIEKLPEKLDLLLTVVPTDIKISDVFQNIVIEEIIKVINYLHSNLKSSSFLSITLFKLMKDIQCSLDLLLGISVNEEFLMIMIELQEEFEVFVLNDYEQFLNRIIEMDRNSISEKSDGKFYTPAPVDLFNQLDDGYKFVKSSGLSYIEPIRVNFINILIKKLDEFGDSLNDIKEEDYLIAVCNNSHDAQKLISNISQNNPQLLEKSEKQLIKAWRSIMKKCINGLYDLLYSSIIKEDRLFKEDFYEKIEQIKNYLDNVLTHLIEPLYFNFYGIFYKKIIVSYICSYFTKPEDTNEINSFRDKVKDECSTLNETLEEYKFGFSLKSSKIIEAFQDLLTLDLSESVHLAFLCIAKEYTDFTPEIAGIILKVRPDISKQELEETIQGFKMVYDNVEKKKEDNLFSESQKPEKLFKLF